MTASPSSLEYSAKDYSPYLFRVGILFLVLQSVFFVLFIVSRVVSKTATGIDFWLLIPIAYIFAILNCAFNLSIFFTTPSIKTMELIKARHQCNRRYRTTSGGCRARGSRSIHAFSQTTESSRICICCCGSLPKTGAARFLQTRVSYQILWSGYIHHDGGGDRGLGGRLDQHFGYMSTFRVQLGQTDSRWQMRKCAGILSSFLHSQHNHRFHSGAVASTGVAQTENHDCCEDWPSSHLRDWKLVSAYQLS